MRKKGIYISIIKPLMDFTIALIFVIILLPIFILLIVLLLFANKGKVFFIQKRPGFNGKLFGIIKFKTMTDKRDEKGELLPNHLRITGVGNFMRKTSLDELPQLFNVLKRDISLIGPRPLLPEYLPLYNKEQAKRHDIKPGITGLAQVNGRNAISWEEKFKHDIYYVENCSFLLDIKIIFLTFLKLIRPVDINSGEKQTMSKFTGTKE